MTISEDISIVLIYDLYCYQNRSSLCDILKEVNGILGYLNKQSMEDKLNQLLDKITKLSQVSHLNFLFGSGASDPFIPPQTNIEKNLDQALNESNTDNEKKYKKEFFEKVIHPCIEIKDYTFTSSTDQHDNLTQSYTCYRNFLIEITKYILARKSPLLNKQANIFTTNLVQKLQER